VWSIYFFQTASHPPALWSRCLDILTAGTSSLERVKEEEEEEEMGETPITDNSQCRNQVWYFVCSNTELSQIQSLMHCFCFSFFLGRGVS
jgi:hypothetical protein